MKPPSNLSTTFQHNATPAKTRVRKPVGNPFTPILETFTQLQKEGPQPEGLRAFSVRPFPGRPQHHLAIDGQGAPAVLLRARANPTLHFGVPHLGVEHDVLCNITHADGTRDQHTFLVVRCRGDDAGVHGYFLNVVGGAVLALPDDATTHDVAEMTEHVAYVLADLNREPRLASPELWAEVFIIARATDTAQAVQVWRDHPENTYSFGTNGKHAEVKCTVGKGRQHNFSLKQLRLPFDGGDVTILSLKLQPSRTEVSLSELIREVRARLLHDQAMLKRFDCNVAMALGHTLVRALSTGFDTRLAARNLRLMAAGDIPCLSTALPEGISDLRFTVNVGSVPASKVTPQDSLHVALNVPRSRQRGMD
ncbi:PD-(D/E)XK motif protein [Deinococcus marmoris]|uniref:PD-(D/E)XK motif protein n=1 Tax=Deinococcus marmoris TaxID=249408 RepID=UPI000495716F|nr:PD-(D/E)XK motif protein [Deinococcus marmoris]